MPKTSTQINANEKHERFEPRVKSLEKGFKEMIVEFDRMVSYHKSLGTAESAFAKALMKVGYFAWKALAGCWREQLTQIK